MPLSIAQTDLLRHIAEATETWARADRPARPFLLLHLGGMKSTVDHPGWDSSWRTPSEHDIDDLAELGLLRVEPSFDKRRTFVLSVRGAQTALEFVDAENKEAGVSEADEGPAGRHPGVFVSWAHDGPDWEATVYAFVRGLYANGVAAEVDLFHLNDPRVNWADYGPAEIESSEFVLMAVSAAYKRRWDGTEDPAEGAGAAAEANTLKSIFGDDRREFLRRVKAVVLPGASESDIPLVLKAVVQRFEIDPKSPQTFEHLVRTLTGQPAFTRPTLGDIPTLPPKVADATVAQDAGSGNTELLGFIDELGDALDELGNGYLRSDHEHLYGVVLSQVKGARPQDQRVAMLSEPKETAMSGIYRPTASEARAALAAMRSALLGSSEAKARPRAQPAPLDPMLLRGRILPNQFAASVSASDPAFVLRAGLAAALPEHPAPMIESSDEKHFLDLVRGSSLAAWTAKATSTPNDWRSIEPTSSLVVTLRQPVAPSLTDGWELECRAFVTVAPDHSLRPRGYGILLLDVVFRPTGAEPHTTALTLDALLELSFVLTAALVDQVGLPMFQRLGRGAESHALSISVTAQSFGLPLSAFLEFQRPGWSRAEGSHDRPGSEWEPTNAADVGAPERRAEEIRKWIKRLLRDSGIRGHEEAIDALPVPVLPTSR